MAPGATTTRARRLARSAPNCVATVLVANRNLHRHLGGYCSRGPKAARVVPDKQICSADAVVCAFGSSGFPGYELRVLVGPDCDRKPHAVSLAVRCFQR